MTRFYTLEITVEVEDQDDTKHFQPNTVSAYAPQLGLRWVSGSDQVALKEFFDFFVRAAEIPAGMSMAEFIDSPFAAGIRSGIQGIADRAYAGGHR